MNILYISLKHVKWRFRICNYFREIFKFRDFMNTLRNFAKSVFAHCCVSNYLISDFKNHFSAKIPDSASGQFTSGSASSLKRKLVD